jgi:molybdopterin biosynthesis enzyme
MAIRTVEDAKARAADLRKIAAGRGLAISHAQALEIVAKEQKARDWNTLRARLAKAGPDSSTIDFLGLRRGYEVEGRYMNQPFTGRVVEAIAAGEGLRLAIHLDQAVDIVTFASFSNMRRRVSGTIGKDGRSAEQTSDGCPHLLITGIREQK